ncbi:uncharacterized protein LOC127707509 [Mytilus californianus]|uniref:uncharacterized protein LOC127707509 n=1 Tax=Mytilus californianus TaxID=6549 RepID=UPI002245907E|nr:uncharacterized protein LOC127707509 [Mytilus californianus]
MYIEANGKSRNDKAQLISKPIVRKQSQCLRFWYHMYGDQIGTLNVYQKLKKSMDNIWTITGNQDKQWNQANVDLHPYEYYQIVIEGKLKDPNFRPRGYIAIDDIYVEEGHCTERSKIICTFEQLSTCGLSNALYDYEYYFSWNIVQGDTTSIGPNDDHTTASAKGSFFHLESESSGTGRLESEPIELTGPICLTFWYYMIGNTWNNLTLYTTSDVKFRNILSIYGDSGDKWKEKTVSIDIAYNDIIVIEGYLKQRGSISFDDISLSQGSCIEDKAFNQTCLNIYQQNEIEKCATFYLQNESLDVTLYPSFTNSNNGKECIGMENEIVPNLAHVCRTTYLYSNCKFDLTSLIWNYNYECFTFKKKILITYLCTDEKTTTVSSYSTTGDSSAGLVVGLVIGGLLLACAVIFIVVLLRRHTLKSKPREKLKNNLGGKDYIGSQDIALPQTVSHSSHMQNDGTYDQLESTNTSVNGYESTQINNVQHKYNNVSAADGYVYKEGVQRSTNAVRRDKTFADNHMSNDDEYAIVDPTAETSFNGNIDNKTATADSYMVLDPKATDWNSTTFSNTHTDYEFAKPVRDTGNKIADDDQYDLSNDGAYDHSGDNRHKEPKDNIYNHAVDTVYDSGSYKRNTEEREDTYDHCIGQKTEDDYDISSTT